MSFNNKTFTDLLDRFKPIPKSNISPPTFMEIAGYPHYENVSSNILSFFFDSTQIHQLDDLMVISLLECIGHDHTKIDTRTVEVNREVPTRTGKRIDLIVECEEIVVIIENKIGASLYNDLNDYSKYATETYHGKEIPKEILKVVLSIDKLQGKLKAGFTNITYDELIEEVKSKIGKKLLQGNTKYLTFFIDYLKTMQNLTKPEEMDKEILDFFIKEKGRIEELLEEKRKIDNFIFNKCKDIMGLVDLAGLPKTNQWIWRKFDLIHDITVQEGITISVDCIFEFDGIKIVVWVRKGKVDKLQFLKSLEIFNEKKSFEGSNRIVVQKKAEMGLLTPQKEVTEKLNSILRKIKLIDE